MARKGFADRGLYERKLPSRRTLWYIRYAEKGRDVRRGGFKTKAEARRAYQRIKQEQFRKRHLPDEPKDPPHTFTAVRDAYLDAKAGLTTVKDLKRHLDWWFFWWLCFRFRTIYYIGIFLCDSLTTIMYQYS